MDTLNGMRYEYDNLIAGLLGCLIGLSVNVITELDIY